MTKTEDTGCCSVIEMDQDLDIPSKVVIIQDWLSRHVDRCSLSVFTDAVIESADDLNEAVGKTVYNALLVEVIMDKVKELTDETAETV
jgi:hypothetical protein